MLPSTHGLSDNGIDLQILADAGTVAVPGSNDFAGDTYFIDDGATSRFRPTPMPCPCSISAMARPESAT